MKKMKFNSKGVTLIALIVTVVVLIILASITIYSGAQTVKSSKFTAFSVELKIMQTQVNDWYQKYTTNGTVGDKTGEDILTLGTDISTVQEQADKVFTAEESGITDKSGYRYFSSDLLKQLGVEGVTEDFFINIAKRSVVDYEGFEYDGKTYYTVDSLPDGFYNVDYEGNSGELDFDINYQQMNDGKYKVTISNINYAGNINKWYVQYRKSDSETWNNTEDLYFTVDAAGKYFVRIYNGDISGEKTFKIEPIVTTLEKIKGDYFEDDTKLLIDGNKIMIPGGATVSGIDNECSAITGNQASKDEGGLVIYITNEEKSINWNIETETQQLKKEYDQFVWIPVETPYVTIDKIGGNSYQNLKTYVAENNVYPMAIKMNDGNYKGILYEFEDDGELSIIPMNYTTTNSNREPDEVNSDSSNGIAEGTLQQQFNTMVDRVVANGGFWVGRYETSNMDSQAYTTEDGAVEIVEGTDSGINSQNWYQMYNSQKSYREAKIGSKSETTSSMIWGSQWDQIMIWLKSVPTEYNGTAFPGKFYITNAVGMGNYGVNENGVVKNNKQIEKTGYYGVKNIFDLAGNIEEWTLEASGADVRIVRRRTI